jgi:hypothetical protein
VGGARIFFQFGLYKVVFIILKTCFSLLSFMVDPEQQLDIPGLFLYRSKCKQMFSSKMSIRKLGGC